MAGLTSLVLGGALVGCGDAGRADDVVDFASDAVPDGPESAAAPSPAEASVDADVEAEVLAAYREYVTESERFIDVSIAEAAAAGVFAGTSETDRILDAVAMDFAREFDHAIPMTIWEQGAVETVGSPVVVSAEIASLDDEAGVAEVRACTDVRQADYLDAAGQSLKPSNIPDFYVDDVSMVRQANPLNDGIVRWYVVDRITEEAETCVLG